MNATNAQIDAYFGMVSAIADCIKSLGSVPSGHLYAHLMGKIDIHTYNAIITSLKKARMIEEKNYLLTWIGK